MSTKINYLAAMVPTTKYILKKKKILDSLELDKKDTLKHKPSTTQVINICFAKLNSIKIDKIVVSWFLDLGVSHHVS